MTIEAEVQALTVATTDLLEAVNVGKAALDQAVATAEGAASSAWAAVGAIQPGGAGVGTVPPGGASGQVLAKASVTDYDTAWVDPPEGGTVGPVGPVSYNDLTDLPSAFQPTAHTHAIADVIGLQAALDNAGGSDGAAAVAAHEAAVDPHPQYLQAADVGTAAAKNAPATGNAATGEVVLGSDTRLSDARTPTAHTHTISNVVGLQTALDGKQAAGSYQPLAAVLTGTTASFTTAQEAKLAGIANGATANATDAQLRDRATHTGTQTASTISDFAAAVAATAAVAANTAKVSNATHTGDVTGSVALTIAADAVTNTKLANMATATIKGRVLAGTGDPEDLTVAQVKTLLAYTPTDIGAATAAQGALAATAVQPAAIASMVASNTTGISGADPITNIVSLTQAEYDAIGTKNPSTLYVIAG